MPFFTGGATLGGSLPYQGISEGPNRSTSRITSLVRFVDSRTEKDTRFYQNLYTPLSNLPVDIGYLSLVEACRGIDTHMTILVLIALRGGLYLGLGAQCFGQEADFGEVFTNDGVSFSEGNSFIHPANDQ